MGKREGLAGAETCFYNAPYIKPNGKEDAIPFTKLTECNKTNTNRKRCFLYAYQVTMRVEGDQIIEPRMYTKITFKQMKGGLIMLPGDELKTSFSSSYTE